MRRYGIVGAGAVGGYFGFRIAASGRSVHFLVRGATLAALRGRGLRVTTEGVPRAVAVEASDDPAGLGECDTVLVTVKNPDLEGALEAVRGGLAEKAFAVTLQNGLDAPRAARRVLGAGRVVAGIAYLGAEAAAPGEILHTGLGLLTVGEPEGGPSARCQALAEDLNACGIPTRTSERIEEDLWKKLAWNAAFNGPTALARCSPAALAADPEGRALARALIQEVLEAARTTKLDLPATLADDQIRLSEPLTELRTSMLQDLEAGRPMEIEALYTRTLRLLREAGKPAPAHQAVVALLSAARSSFRAYRSR